MRQGTKTQQQGKREHNEGKDEKRKDRGGSNIQKKQKVCTLSALLEIII
jgi:hypothetical protein